MRNLLRFIQQNGNFLLFLLLEAVAFLWLVNEQKYQQSTFLSSSNTVIASVNSALSDMNEYFHLSSVNESLSAENARLRRQVDELQNIVEREQERDSVYLYAHLQWQYIPAKVVDMETSSQHNYLVLNKGERDGVGVGQGVMSSDGIVGVVGAVNQYYAQVVPIIHPKMRLSCRLQSSSQAGFLQWTGPSAHYAYLTDIGRHISVEKGDSVMTSGLTNLFPENIPIGVIEDVSIKEGDTYYTLLVRLTTDFGRLRYVQIVTNPLKSEQDNVRTAS